MGLSHTVKKGLLLTAEGRLEKFFSSTVTLQNRTVVLCNVGLCGSHRKKMRAYFCRTAERPLGIGLKISDTGTCFDVYEMQTIS